MNKAIIMAGLAGAAITFFSFRTHTTVAGFDLKASIARGQEIYNAQCMSCHMEKGEGMEGIYPPLAKSNYLADRDRLIKIVRKGIRGPIKVNGADYDSEMVGFDLTDEQTSDVINYIRNAWGNKHAAVTPEQIPAGLNTTSKDYQQYE